MEFFINVIGRGEELHLLIRGAGEGLHLLIQSAGGSFHRSKSWSKVGALN